MPFCTLVGFYDVYSPFVRRLCYVCVLNEAAYKDAYFLVYMLFFTRQLFQLNHEENMLVPSSSAT